MNLAASVKVVELPELPLKGDIVDWLKSSRNTGNLLLDISNRAPFYKVNLQEKLVGDTI